ncbi:MAG: haloacid dehalogenase [Caulobacteraceae bacterium]|nr:haloacid dehalogenase [Caulobacteraceae bacterium]
MRLIIFDFDGVIADSERVANQVLAEGLSGIGLATTVEDALRLYLGRRWRDCQAAIEERHGAPLPEGFIERQRAAVIEQLSRGMQPVPGARAFIERFQAAPRCIASSSTQEWIAAGLDHMGLAHRFEHRFSGHDIERGKPHPDLFLLAASTLGAAPRDCIVIEDSQTGVMAGVAAGMLTIGLCAGGHIVDGHAERLTAAGADHVVTSYDAVAAIVEPLLARG